MAQLCNVDVLTTVDCGAHRAATPVGQRCSLAQLLACRSAMVRTKNERPRDAREVLRKVGRPVFPQ